MTEPILFRGKESDPINLGEVICQAIGAASICWDHPRRAGVFNSDRALAISDEVIAWIDAHYTERTP